MDEITKVLFELYEVEETFRKIQKNPAFYISEHGGLSPEKLELLEKVISLVGEAAIAGNEICDRDLK